MLDSVAMDVRLTENGREHQELLLVDRTGRILPAHPLYPGPGDGCRSAVAQPLAASMTIALHIFPDDDPPCCCGLVQPTRWIPMRGGPADLVYDASG